MRVAWAVLLGIAVGGGMAWWMSRDAPRQVEARQQRAERAAARPVLYRWHDANGILQVTEQPPKGRRYERIGVAPRKGIEVRGDRE